MNQSMTSESKREGGAMSAEKPEKFMKTPSLTTMLSLAGMFAALVFLATWMLHVPAGIGGGYVHFGDAMVYLAASFLPLPFAMAASAVGAGLSDLATPGAAMWILPTVIIKSLCCLPFTHKNSKLLCRRNIVATVAAGLITAVGYGIATAVIARSVTVALTELPFSLIQASGSALFFIVIAAALDRAKIKNMLWGRKEGL